MKQSRAVCHLIENLVSLQIDTPLQIFLFSFVDVAHLAFVVLFLK